MSYNSLPFQRLIVLVLVLLLPVFTGCKKVENGHNAKHTDVDIQGIWTGTAQQTGSPNPTFTLKLNVKEGGEVWGTITSMDGTFEQANISGGKIEGNKLTFSATANGTNFRNGHSFSFDAAVKGNSLEGIWKDILDRNWGSFTVVRKDKAASAEKH